MIQTLKSKNTRAKSLIIGMDEAGRGPVLGPLVFGLVSVTKHQVSILKKIGVDDSKHLSEKKRESLYEQILDNVTAAGVLILPAKDIDALRDKFTLNQIEVMKFKELLQQFTIDVNISLQIDAADVNAERFGKQFEDIISGEILSKHKADAIYPTVSAASILAKVTRDREIQRIQEEMKEFDKGLPTIGSGYPNKITTNFIREYYLKYKKLPKYTRTSWETAKNIEREGKKTSLDKFF